MSYKIATLACRFWLSLTLFSLGLVWAENTTALAVIVGVGVILDGIRKRASPDFDYACDDILKLYTNIARDAPWQRTLSQDRERLWWKMILLLPIGWAGVVGVDGGLRLIGVEGGLGFMSPVGDLLQFFYEPVRRHTQILLAHGYADRVHIVSVVYAADVLLFVCGVFYMTRGRAFVTTVHLYHFSLIMSTGDEAYFIRKRGGVGNVINGTILVLLTVLIAAEFLFINPIGGEVYSAFPYPLERNHLYSFVQMVVLCGTLYLNFFAYMQFVKARVSGCPGWRQVMEAEIR